MSKPNKKQGGRAQRRRLEKVGAVDKFDPNKHGRIKYSVELPPGLLRDDGNTLRKGSFQADNEIDLTRGMFVKLLECYGYINQQQAMVALFAAVVNPFPKHIRGAIAYAIINGTGLMIDEQEVEVCTFCEGEKQATIDLEADVLDENECQVAEGSGVCGVAPDEGIHNLETEGNDWLHDFEEPGPVMRDTTLHAANCNARPFINALEEWREGTEDRHIDESQWKEIEAVVVLTPQMFESLNPAPEEGEVVEEDGNELLEEPIDMKAAGEALADQARPDSKDELIDDNEE